MMPMDVEAPEQLFNIEAEQSVLGAVLLDNTAWDRVAGLIGEADFFRADHRLIWRHLGRMVEANLKADVVTVAESMESTGDFDKVEKCLAYLAALAQNTPSAANAHRYAGIVREYALLRRLASTALVIHDSTRERGGLSVAEILDRAQGRIMEVAEAARHQAAEFASVTDLLPQAIDHINAMFQKSDSTGLVGVPTGFSELDEKTLGFEPGDLIIVAARPSMGKTGFALNIAEHVAAWPDCGPAAVFSMEMNASQLMFRLLSKASGINAQQLKRGRLREDDWPRLTHAVGVLGRLPMHINEQSNMSINELRAAARRLHRSCGGLGLIVVDYLQLMAGSGRAENRALELSDISRSLKGLAKELHLPVIALSQLNRGLENRPNKRPIMSDLRDSGAIEQDADTILFIYRDEYYNPDSADRGMAEIIIGKQRNGPTGTIRLGFDQELVRFYDLPAGYVPADREEGGGRE